MTLIPTWEQRQEPICEKHNFQGIYCYGCIADEKRRYALQKQIEILSEFIVTINEMSESPFSVLKEYQRQIIVRPLELKKYNLQKEMELI